VTKNQMSRLGVIMAVKILIADEKDLNGFRRF
jgi:hypothetical protein